MALDEAAEGGSRPPKMAPPSVPSSVPSSDTESLREAFEERAAIMEYDGGLSRENAEARAWAIVYGEPGDPARELAGTQPQEA